MVDLVGISLNLGGIAAGRLGVDGVAHVGDRRCCLAGSEEREQKGRGEKGSWRWAICY